jgi:hypothetical protein
MLPAAGEVSAHSLLRRLVVFSSDTPTPASLAVNQIKQKGELHG